MKILRGKNTLARINVIFRQDAKNLKSLKMELTDLAIGFQFCPCCGSLMPESLDKLKGFFDIYDTHPALEKAINIMYKSEFEASAREAFVVLENYLKKKSGLDSHGFDLATRALSFEVDKKTEKKKVPLIAINELKTESDRNEQDGIRYISWAFSRPKKSLSTQSHCQGLAILFP